MCTKVLPFVLLCIRGAICLISLEFNLADCVGKTPANLAFSQMSGEKTLLVSVVFLVVSVGF